MSKIVYILTNPSMPGLIKIGAADDLPKRMRELYKTNVPTPFECFFAGKVDDGESVKRHLHGIFHDHRVSLKREFFRVDPHKVRNALKLANPIDVTPEKSAAENELNMQVLKKRGAKMGSFNFLVAGIHEGTILTFHNDENITCKVISDRKVEFEGENHSLSSAALKVLHKMGHTTRTSARGPFYWCYEGETLYNRRGRLEKESDA